MEKIEIRVVDGLHQAYYKGVKLPFLIDSSITQGVDKSTTEAVLRFRVDLQELNNKVVFKIDESSLIKVCDQTLKRNNAK